MEAGKLSVVEMTTDEGTHILAIEITFNEDSKIEISDQSAVLPDAVREVALQLIYEVRQNYGKRQ